MEEEQDRSDQAVDAAVASVHGAAVCMVQQRCFSGQAPVFDGRILIHYRIMFTAYHFFVSTLVAMARGLEHLDTFGTDVEGVLMTAFQQAFNSAVNFAIVACTEISKIICKD